MTGDINERFIDCRTSRKLCGCSQSGEREGKTGKGKSEHGWQPMSTVSHRQSVAPLYTQRSIWKMTKQAGAGLTLTLLYTHTPPRPSPATHCLFFKRVAPTTPWVAFGGGKLLYALWTDEKGTFSFLLPFLSYFISFSLFFLFSFFFFPYSINRMIVEK